MAVEEATRKGLIDKQYEQILTRAEKAVNGYKTKTSDDVVSINQALKRGILTENHAIRPGLSYDHFFVVFQSFLVVFSRFCKKALNPRLDFLKLNLQPVVSLIRLTTIDVRLSLQSIATCLTTRPSSLLKNKTTLRRASLTRTLRKTSTTG